MPKPSSRKGDQARKRRGSRAGSSSVMAGLSGKAGLAISGVSIAARELAGVRELVMLVQLLEGAKSYEEIKEDYERFTRDRVHPRAMYRIIKGLMKSDLVEYPEPREISAELTRTGLNYYVVAPRGRVVLRAMRDYLNVEWARTRRRAC